MITGVTRTATTAIVGTKDATWVCDYFKGWGLPSKDTITAEELEAILQEFGRVVQQMPSVTSRQVACVWMAKELEVRTNLHAAQARDLVRAASRDPTLVEGANADGALQLQWHSLADLRNRPYVEDIVAGHLPKTSFAVLYGPAGGGKTFAAIDIALSIASGIPWHGHAVEQGPIVYIAAEGAQRIVTRFDSWLEAHGCPELAPVHLLDEPVRFLEDPATLALLHDLSTFDPIPTLITVDTLSQCLPGGDENAPRDMSAFVDAVNQVKRATGATVIALHHSGWDPKHERGHTSLRGGADTIIKVTQDDDMVSIACEKQRDGMKFDTVRLQLTPLGESCYLDTIDHTSDNLELTRNELRALEALVSIALDDGVPATAWHQTAGLAHSSFYRSRKSLVLNGYVRREKNRYFPTDSAIQAVSPTEVPF